MDKIKLIKKAEEEIKLIEDKFLIDFNWIFKDRLFIVKDFIYEFKDLITYVKFDINYDINIFISNLSILIEINRVFYELEKETNYFLNFDFFGSILEYFVLVMNAALDIGIENDEIFYYVYECDYGEDTRKKIFIYDKEVDISTKEKFYWYLKGKPFYYESGE